MCLSTYGSPTCSESLAQPLTFVCLHLKGRQSSGQHSGNRRRRMQPRADGGGSCYLLATSHPPLKSTHHSMPMRRYLAAVDPQVSSKSPEGITAFRQAAEAALAAAGLHLTEAAALWQEYRCASPSVLLQQHHRRMAAAGVSRQCCIATLPPPLAHTVTQQPCLPAWLPISPPCLGKCPSGESICAGLMSRQCCLRAKEGTGRWRLYGSCTNGSCRRPSHQHSSCCRSIRSGKRRQDT